MLTIRLRRMGKRDRAFYRFVVSDSRKTPTASAVEEVGHYDPLQKQIELKRERIDYWVSNGAILSNSVKTLIRRADHGILTAAGAEKAEPETPKPEQAKAEKAKAAEPPAKEAQDQVDEKKAEAAEKAETKAAEKKADAETKPAETKAEDKKTEGTKAADGEGETAKETESA